MPAYKPTDWLPLTGDSFAATFQISTFWLRDELDANDSLSGVRFETSARHWRFARLFRYDRLDGGFVGGIG